MMKETELTCTRKSNTVIHMTNSWSGNWMRQTVNPYQAKVMTRAKQLWVGRQAMVSNTGMNCDTGASRRYDNLTLEQGFATFNT